MIRVSLLRKTRFGGSKGVSTVIGTIFLVLIVLVAATNVFLWSITQNALYNQAVKESRQMDADRSSERIVASKTNYSVPQSSTVEVSVTVSNEGPVFAQILTLWVLDENTKKHGFNDTLNINLNPGDKRSLTLKVVVPDATPYHTFNGWLVTARGNLVSLEEEKEKIVVIAHVAQGIGSIMMDLYTFRYYSYESSNVLKNYPDGTPSLYIPKEPVAFGVILTNFDEDQRTIYLDSSSLLWVLYPVSDVAHSRWWYIVSVTSNGTIFQNYSGITLGYGDSKLIVFASKRCGLFDSGGSDQVTPRSGPVSVNLLLHGTIGDKPYGQNIPFVSLYFSE